MAVFRNGRLYSGEELLKSGNLKGNITDTSFGQAVGSIVNTVQGAIEDVSERGVSGIWDDYTGNSANQANIDYQREYNAEVFKRADTQYQRTVADLRAAGLSSQLAAGSPSTVAGASSAPQRTVGNESAAIERLVGMITAMKQTNANANLASAQADKARADAASVNVDTKLKNLELGSYGERTSVSIAVQRAQAKLYSAQTQLMQIEGQSKGALIQSEIQRNLSTSSYQNNLADLAVKQMDLVSAQTTLAGKQSDKIDADIAHINKQISLIGYQISSEVAKKRNYDASTEYIIRQTTNAALDYVIQDAIFQYNTERGDSPNATQVSSSQSEEKKKDRIHDYIVKGISGLGAVAAGAGFSLFGVGRGIKQKMFGDDHSTLDPTDFIL